VQLNEWIKAARKRAELTQEQLGERLDVTKGNVSAWENGRHQPSYSQLKRIEEITGYPLEGGPRAAPLLALEPPPEDAGPVTGLRPVPVVGTAKLGENGYYEEISSIPGAGDGHVEHMSRDAQAYALRVRGSSMHPAIRDGWYVIVEPNAPPVTGEYVLVKLANGQRMVKELLIMRSDSIEIMSVNGGERRTIYRDELESVQAVKAVLGPSQWKPE
jgi:transcriptional regulator with XRE-family HTH domain